MFFSISANSGSSVDTSKDGIVRTVSKSKVSAGETFTIKYYINTVADQKYYIIEDDIPKDFQVVDCEHDSANYKSKLWRL